MLYVPEQRVLLNILDELGDDDVGGAGQGTVLSKKTAAGDGGDYTVKKGEWLSGGRRLTEHLRDGVHVFVGDRGAVVPGPQLHMSVFGKACPVDTGVIDGSVHRAGMDAVCEIERHRKSAFINWRGV